MLEEKRKKLIRMKAIFLSILYFLSCSFYSNDSSNKKNSHFVKNIIYDRCNNLDYAFLNGKKVYIVNDKIFESFDINDNDIFIVDCTDGINPSFHICDSYKIDDCYEIYNILDILLEYESDYPSNFDRSLDGMYIEWIIHNICYNFNILKGRSGSVDIDNYDAIIYENDIVKKLFIK